jgi:type IV pilus assembly protein PilV
MTEAVSRRQAGVAMLESLFAMAVLMVGMLGIAGLQAKTQMSHFEAYQRAQALLLLDDIVNRINANRSAADCYAFTAANGVPYLGEDGLDHKVDYSCVALTGTVQTRAIAQNGMGDWDLLLQGAAEIDANDDSRGAMIDARGCVSFDPVTDMYTVAVAWQGMVPTMAPAVNCANGLYGAETNRRVVTTTFRIANLAS